MTIEMANGSHNVAERSANARPKGVPKQTRAAITAQLTQIWQDMLGIHPIAPDQNYFELGGDSILAVQLFIRIEEEFEIKLPLATLFDAPTIRELTVVLEQERSARDWSPLVAIQPSGTRPPFFCMHPHGGNVLTYRDLARRLGSDQPFYGLQSPGLDGSRPPLTRIEDMASLYIKEIRRVQPTGPYFIGGYCMGGTIAYAVAQQLQAEGEKIALLALFDTPNWAGVGPLTFWQRVYYNGERITFHATNVLSLSSSERGKFLDEKLASLRSRIPVWLRIVYKKVFARPDVYVSQTSALARVWEANLRACASYNPQPYLGTVTDFRPAKQYRMLRKSNLKWKELATAGQEVVVLPVNPPAMLSEPFVSHLAAALRKFLDRAIQAASHGISSECFATPITNSPLVESRTAVGDPQPLSS
jgi:thioesterase domain-containing protein/acyl carrier protein